MKTETLHGWQHLGVINDEEIYYNETMDMMITTTPLKTTLVRENTLHLSFGGPAHFFDAIRKSDEIAATYTDLQ